MSTTCTVEGKPSSLIMVLVFLALAGITSFIWWVDKTIAQYSDLLVGLSGGFAFLAFMSLHRKSCLNLQAERMERHFFGFTVKRYRLSCFTEIVSRLKCIGETDRDFRIDIYFVSSDERAPDFLFSSYWFSAKSLEEAMNYSLALEMVNNLSKLTGLAVTRLGIPA